MSEPQQTITVQKALDLAVQHHTAGRLSQAENIYQQILENDPNQPAALNLLGVTAHQVGKNDLAVDLISKALEIKPDYAEAHNSCGVILKELKMLTCGGTMRAVSKSRISVWCCNCFPLANCGNFLTIVSSCLMLSFINIC